MQGWNPIQKWRQKLSKKDIHYCRRLCSVADPWHFGVDPDPDPRIRIPGSGSPDPCLWLMDPDPDPGSGSYYFCHCQQGDSDRNAASMIRRIRFLAVLRIRIRIRIRMFLGLPDPHPDPLVTSPHPDPLVTSMDPAPDQAKNSKKTLISTVLQLNYDFFIFEEWRKCTGVPNPHPDPYVFVPPGSHIRISQRYGSEDPDPHPC